MKRDSELASYPTVDNFHLALWLRYSVTAPSLALESWDFWGDEKGSQRCYGDGSGGSCYQGETSPQRSSPFGTSCDSIPLFWAATEEDCGYSMLRTLQTEHDPEQDQEENRNSCWGGRRGRIKRKEKRENGRQREQRRRGGRKGGEREGKGT